MTTSKGRLFQIAKECKQYIPKQESKRKRVKVEGRHYDEGKAISLSYNLEMYHQSIYDAYRHQEPSAQLSFVDELQNESFYVEPFESSEVVQVGYEEVKEDDAILEKIVKNPDVQPEGKHVEIVEKDQTDQAEKQTADKGQTGPVETTRDYERDIDVSDKEALKTFEANREKTEGGAAKTPYELEDDEFANDIQAILQGKKVFDPNQKKAVGRQELSPAEKLKPSVEQQPKTQEEEAEVAMDPAKNEHKIFEKIAQSMRYANSYDLGSIAMEKKFDKMESEIEQDELKKINEKHTTKGNIEEAEVTAEKGAVPGEVEVKKEQKLTPAEVKYDPQKLLTPENGGRVLQPTELLSGDLVLITSKAEGNSLSDSPRCYAGLFVGGEFYMTGHDKVLRQKLLSDTLSESHAVVLRHQQSDDVTNKLEKPEVSGKTEPLVEVAHTPISIHRSVCEGLTESEKNKCQLFSGKVDIGTTSNDHFIISYPIIRHMEVAGLKFSESEIENITGETIIKATNNGQLQYAGHLQLKNQQL
ncbi:hypothetical protein C900_01244 [Fulvivirga imtechensis AK7]|uniref:Uncharacterized protein n=1 Tax=Fulvivirga imtechensis AK7 TaxID=1237149 RepID=L8JUU3_9BACT|nr:hypothetical protein [Fulvivirga imtechensis]ELR72570.1 hypothetical protein C900_01244 [Fulvivirga imtechensis AK7]